MYRGIRVLRRNPRNFNGGCLANNYLQFSEIIEKVTAEEAAWAKARLHEMTEKFSDHNGDEGWYFEWSIHEAHDPADGPHIWVYSEEGAEPEHVAVFFQEFLKKFRPDSCLSLTWAAFCDKLRVGEFDGGAVFVTAKDIIWHTTGSFLDEQKKLFDKKRKGKKK